MIRSLRAALAIVAISALAGCAANPERLPGAPAASAVAVAPLAAGEWPHARSDLQPDPEVRFGVLPNGMRYALRRQTTPPGQAALRLRIAAGSLMEADGQQGLAHFLEHMAFNGSEAVPEGEMIKILERLGLAFGADTNASTSFDETIYKLDLPRTDSETVDTSLMLLRQTVGSLTLDPAAVDRERGVVLSEERARDTPAFRVYKDRLDFLLRGQLPPERLPIGEAEVLRTAPAEALRDLYQKYYRPERAVLVAAGDFDLDEMEAKIRARFSGWQAQGPAGAEPDLGRIQPRDPEARLVVEPGAQASLQLAWVRPPDLSPDTQAKRRRDTVERLGFAVLNRRLQRLGRAPEPPFLGAAAFKNDEYDAAEVVMLAANVQPGRWREALLAAEQEQRRAVLYGVRPDELTREIQELRTAFEAAAAGAATRRPAQLAGDILAAVPDDEVVTSPQQELALFDAAVKEITPAEVSAALAAAFQGEGPLLFMVSPTPIEGGEAALLAELKASRATAVAEPAAPRQVAWPYESFGPPGQVVEQREAQGVDAVFVRFANGVRLTVKPTPFRDDQVLVRVNVGDGLLDLPADRQSLAWAKSAYSEGGLAKISAEEMEQVLASKVYSARFSITDDAFVLSGGTRPEHLDTQLQVLAAYLVEPGWRPEAFERLKTAAASIHDQYEATVSGVLSRELAGLLHSGDRRWTFPSRDDIAQAQPGEFMAQVAPMSEGAIEVVVVGDTTVEQAVEAVARTFGALPPRRPAASPGPSARGVAFPAPPPEPLVLTHKGRADQATAYIAWPTTDFFEDPQRARDTAVMGEILRLRLTEELREAQAATYSPSVSYNHSFVWTGWGYVGASVEVPPDRLEAFFDDVERIAADLRARPVSADELARAKTPRIERFEKARQTNEYWLSELSGAQADPRRLEAVQAAIPGTERVTAADVRRAAEFALRPERAYRLVVLPQAR